MKRILTLLLITLLSMQVVNAQNTKKSMPFNIGLYGGLNFNMHNPNFYEDVYDLSVFPPTYMFTNKYADAANSIGWNLGLIANIPLSDMFVLSGRFGYNVMGGDLKDTSGFNTLTTKLNYFEISPVLQIHNLIEDSGLFFLLGAEFGLPMTNSFHYTYDNGTTPFVSPEKDIPQTETRIALILGLGWMFEISDDVYLTPEVSYRLPFTKVSAEPILDSWKISQIRAGLNLTFGIRGSDQEEIVETQPVTEKGYVDLTMGDVSGLNMRGDRVSLAKIRVEETQYSELFPIIPYVFFDEKTENPNPKTQNLSSGNEAGSFNVESMQPDAVQINNNTLDIVGVRMQQDKNSTIKLIGTVDAKNESAKSDLNKKRADFAKNYLVNNYNIDGNRIKVETTGLPSKPSSVKDKEGIEENRRVEIVQTNGNSLLKPIVIHSDKSRIANPPVILFMPNVSTNEQITSWDLDIRQNDRLLKRYSGYEKPETIQWSISPNELASNNDPVDYKLIVRTTSGITDEYEGRIPVEFISTTKKMSEESDGKSISKYSLVLFDFDSPKVSELDKSILDEYVIPNIKENSTVQIYGYTDRIGDEKYNKKLADQRANAVRDIMKSKASNATYEVYGVGEGVQIYDNNLPTGRQLSRTVQIYIVTPKK